MKKQELLDAIDLANGEDDCTCGVAANSSNPTEHDQYCAFRLFKEAVTHIERGWKMVITPEQRDEMLNAAKPLMKWIAENGHPHCKVLVGPANIELVEGVATAGTLEFVKD